MGLPFGFCCCMVYGTLSQDETWHVVVGVTLVGSIWSVALTPDARRLMTASEDFTARVWDVLSGNCAHVLEGHTGWVVHIAATDDGQHCATASHDGTARSASCLLGCCLLWPGHAALLVSLAVAKQGCFAQPVEYVVSLCLPSQDSLLLLLPVALLICALEVQTDCIQPLLDIAWLIFFSFCQAVLYMVAHLKTDLKASFCGHTQSINAVCCLQDLESRDRRM